MPVAASPDLDRIIDRKVKMARVVSTIEYAFSKLPEDADSIAKRFRDGGIVGGHGGTDCPVAVYLQGELKAAGLAEVYVVVGPGRIRASAKPANAYIPAAWQLSWIRPCACGCDVGSPYVIPPGITEFINAHDTHKYPFLSNRYYAPRFEPAVA